MELIDKTLLVAELERRSKELRDTVEHKEKPDIITLFLAGNYIKEYKSIISFINSLEVRNPYEQCIQYDSIKSGIQTYAETYSFNIESKLFLQLTKEQQELWRKEIEQACINGGEAGVELAKDTRYKETLK